jgi:hypothetical protein
MWFISKSAKASIRSFAATGVMFLMFSGQAHAVDGCKVALCIAGNWKSISQCRPEVEQAMHDVERGRGWPSCDMGSGNGAGNSSVDPSLCPDQYKSLVELESGSYWQCQFSSVVDIVVNGQPWTRLWWSPSGDSVTQWMPAARTALVNNPTSMDERFDLDYAAWLAAQPAPTSPDTGGGA